MRLKHHIWRSFVSHRMKMSYAPQVVVTWLSSFGISSCDQVRSQDFIRCQMSVSIAESLLNTKFGYFKHKAEEVVVLRAREVWSEIIGKLKLEPIALNVVYSYAMSLKSA